MYVAGSVTDLIVTTHLCIAAVQLFSKVHSVYADHLLNPFNDLSICKSVKSPRLEKRIDELILTANSELFLPASPLVFKDAELV